MLKMAVQALSYNVFSIWNKMKKKKTEIGYKLLKMFDAWEALQKSMVK